MPGGDGGDAVRTTQLGHGYAAAVGAVFYDSQSVTDFIILASLRPAALLRDTGSGDGSAGRNSRDVDDGP